MADLRKTAPPEKQAEFIGIRVGLTPTVAHIRFTLNGET
jgi:hypothetical protein